MTGWKGSDRFGGRGPLDPTEASSLRKPELHISGLEFFQDMPRQLLARILDGDPLDLELRSEQRRDETCFLISPKRLYRKSAARVAHGGFRYEGTPPIEEWLGKCIDQSIRDILDEDESGDRKKLPIKVKEHYGALSEAIGFTPEISRAAHVSFNLLEQEQRAAYFALCVRGLTIEQYSERGGGTPEVIAKNIAIAANTIIQFLPDYPAPGMN